MVSALVWLSMAVMIAVVAGILIRLKENQRSK